MWLITPFGFFSVVQKPHDAAGKNLTLRARVAGDLAALRDTYLPELGKVSSSSHNDYRYRATAPKKAVQRAMAEMVGDIHYDNFKSEVAQRQGVSRAHLYHDVWQALYDLQEDIQYNWKHQAHPSISTCKASSYGGVLINDQGQTLLREPENHYGGYTWTFAKGRPDAGEVPVATALREVFEETGYQASVIERLPGLFRGSTGDTLFFVMRPEGEQLAFGVETRQTRWCHIDEAKRLVDLSTLEQGRSRDQKVLIALEQWIASNNSVTTYQG